MIANDRLEEYMEIGKLMLLPEELPEGYLTSHVRGNHALAVMLGDTRTFEQYYKDVVGKEYIPMIKPHI